MIHSRKTNSSRWHRLAQLVAVAALALFVSAPLAHAQCPTPVNVSCKVDIPAGTSLLPYIGGDNGPGGIDGVCYSYPTYGCVLVTTFNANSYNYYYVTAGGSSNGFAGQTVFFEKNGVLQGSYKTTNNPNNPGAIVVVASIDSTYTFLGAQHFGNNNCTNEDYYYFGPLVTYTFNNGDGAWYGVGIPYRGTGC